MFSTEGKKKISKVKLLEKKVVTIENEIEKLKNNLLQVVPSIGNQLNYKKVKKINKRTVIYTIIYLKHNTLHYEKKKTNIKFYF